MKRKTKKYFWIVGIVLFLIIIIYFFNSKYSPSLACSNEFQHITTGTFMNDGICCSGLIAKAPIGFAGGAWCVHSDWNVVCDDVDGVSGIYAEQNPPGLANPVNLNMQMNCPIYG